MIAFAITTVLVGLSFLLLMAVHGLGGVLGFYLLFPAIFLASVVFDRASGVYAALLSTGLIYMLIKPSGGILVPKEFAVPLVTFAIVALALAFASETLRTAWERAIVAERTKDLLLQELAHRTKNNLAMVVSMLSLQARSKTDPETKAALEKAVARVHAMAQAHDHFQSVAQSGSVDMQHYLEQLCRHLGDTLRDVRPIAVRVEAERLYLPIEEAVPVGLIVNELVTNAFKHAFPGDHAGVVDVVLRCGPPLCLTVTDDGVGCSPDREERIGSRLMQLLAQQLRAQISWRDAKPGCSVQLVLSRA